jgi:hypothetical protein
LIVLRDPLFVLGLKHAMENHSIPSISPRKHPACRLSPIHHTPTLSLSHCRLCTSAIQSFDRILFLAHAYSLYYRRLCARRRALRIYSVNFHPFGHRSFCYFAAWVRSQQGILTLVFSFTLFLRPLFGRVLVFTGSDRCIKTLRPASPKGSQLRPLFFVLAPFMYF